MRVLVAEHVSRLADAIVAGLREQGMAVDVAHDGHAAAEKIHLTPYDVVVLDRDLQGISGAILCHMIVGSDDPAMILMLAASGAPDERVSGLTLGADDYLPKPPHLPELVLRVRGLARRKPVVHNRKLRVSGIELDTLTGSVARDGRSIDLSAKERAVLEALLKASPGGLNAEQLLRRAWDENIDPFTNTVRVTVGRLRRKLGEPNLIQNTPGIGYGITSDRRRA